MAKSMNGLRFVQQHLAPHLQPYAHLVPSAVNAHVGWLEWKEKEVALLVGMNALREAWEKWQQDPEKFTEKQFFGYAKIKIRGRILDDFKKEIETRPWLVELYKSAKEEQDEVEREKQENWESPLFVKQARADAAPTARNPEFSTAPIRRERSLNGLLQTVTVSNDQRNEKD